MCADRYSPDEQRKRDSILQLAVDTQAIDMKKVETSLYNYLYDRRVSHCELLTDLIIDRLRSERYPCAKVIQSELTDFGLLSDSQARQFMVRLWILLSNPPPTRSQQSDDYHTTKARKLSSSDSSSSRTITASSDDEQYRNYRQSGQSYVSYYQQ